MNPRDNGKHVFPVDVVGVVSFLIILSTGLLEFFIPGGIFLSSGYIIGVLLALLSRQKANIIISALLALIFVGISFARVDDATFKTLLLARAYALVGLSVCGYFFNAVFKAGKQKPETNAHSWQESFLMAHRELSLAG